MAAEALSRGGVRVDLYDAMPSVGRKFLLAGKGGLNLTHAEPLERLPFALRRARARIEPLLAAFGPEALRAWARGLGVDTFVGSSGACSPRT
jgi:predicted flavoprotein YhiN